MLTEYELNGELYHHGIKGQKWGQRRFQDESGKLTPAGRERYRSYKSDYKTAVKLNRRVAASQKHLREEGVMLDRVRDKYMKTNRDYQKAMTKSTGLFGSKSAQKAENVARAQLKMDKAKSDYSNAAGAYGVAKKFVAEDSKALKDHVDGMIRNYGKTSIGSIETKSVKMGQSKLQKLLHGAPLSIVLNKERMSENLIDTGKTLADMPIIGNFYTANYIGKKEMDNDLGAIDRAINSRDAKRSTGKKDKDPAYLNPDYFDGASSSTKDRLTRKMDKAKKEYDDAQSDYEMSKSQWNKSFQSVKNAADRAELAKVDLDYQKKIYGTVKSRTNIAGNLVTGHPVRAAKSAASRASSRIDLARKQATYNKRLDTYGNKNAEQRKDAENIFRSSDRLDDAASKYYSLVRKQKKRRR